MTETLADVLPPDDDGSGHQAEHEVSKEPTAGPEAGQDRASERAAIAQLVRAARARDEELTGPDGLLKTLTATVLETALDEEMTEHLGYDKHAIEGRNGGKSRNGTRVKTRADGQRRAGLYAPQESGQRHPNVCDRWGLSRARGIVRRRQAHLMPSSVICGNICLVRTDVSVSE